MPIVTSLLDGVRRVIRAPVILAGATALTVLLAVPLGLLLRGELETALGDSVVADAMADGFAWEWWRQFFGQATGLGRSFTISVIGFAAVLDNVSALLDGDGQEPVIVGVVLTYIIVWTVFAGGVLDRYARNRATRSAGFFSACGLYGSRLLRLAIVAGLTYGFLFGVVLGWLLDELFEAMTRNLTVERQAFAVRVVLYLVFGLTLAAVSLVFDYARVRAVVEDRRSMLGAVVAGWRFVRRRPVTCAGLYLVNGLVLLAVMAAYALVAPGAASTGPSMWLVFLIGQAYVVARLASKLLFYAAEVAYFQSQLAHAGYVAAPAPVWPESPSAEALGRLG
ncbi:MAG: hypothetical protein QF786_14430 [Vicinamibacterales bacterium]|nr:hypothetical protein [Vicinamibacterales bacterium]